MEDIYKHISSQGEIETSKRHVFNRWISNMIPFSLGFPKSYEILIKGQSNPIELDRAVTNINSIKDSSIKRCESNLCLEFLKDNKTSVMTISTFNYYPWNNLNEFEAFIDESFKKIQSKGIENLVIDLRFNGGGSQHSSIHLLKYLVEHPFTYYANFEHKAKSDYAVGEDVANPFKQIDLLGRVII